jgi:hypothetical protein
MLGQSRKLRIRTRASQDLGIPRGGGAAAFALECPGDDSGATASHARVDEAVYKLDEIVRKTYGDLLAHPIMVPHW